MNAVSSLITTQTLTIETKQTQTSQNKSLTNEFAQLISSNSSSSSGASQQAQKFLQDFMNVNWEAISNQSAATKNISINANLDARVSAGTNFTRHQLAVDSEGNAQNVTVNFTKANGKTWRVDITNTEGERLARGSIVFKNDGTVDRISPSLRKPIKIDWNNGTEQSKITFDFSEMTQLSSYFIVRSQEQDGAVPGNIRTLSVDQEGYITGFYTNGMTKRIVDTPLPLSLKPSDISDLSLGNNSANLKGILQDLLSMDWSKVGTYPVATQNIDISANLKASEKIAAGFDFKQKFEVTDSLGLTQDLEIRYNKRSENKWHVEIFDARNKSLAVGSVNFNSDGTIRSMNQSLREATVNFGNGSAPQKIKINLNLTQRDTNYEDGAISHDGSMGVLKGLSVDQNGYLTANFDNGRTRKVLQHPLTGYTPKPMAQAATFSATVFAATNTEIQVTHLSYQAYQRGAFFLQEFNV